MADAGDLEISNPTLPLRLSLARGHHVRAIRPASIRQYIETPHAWNRTACAPAGCRGAWQGFMPWYRTTGTLRALR